MLDFCINKPDGLQADPMDCRAYYDCAKAKTRHRTGLSVGLMLDPETRQFRHSDKVNCTVRKGEFKTKLLFKKKLLFFICIVVKENKIK